MTLATHYLASLDVTPTSCKTNLGRVLAATNLLQIRGADVLGGVRGAVAANVSGPWSHLGGIAEISRLDRACVHRIDILWCPASVAHAIVWFVWSWWAFDFVTCSGRRLRPAELAHQLMYIGMLVPTVVSENQTLCFFIHVQSPNPIGSSYRQPILHSDTGHKAPYARCQLNAWQSLLQ